MTRRVILGAILAALLVAGCGEGAQRVNENQYVVYDRDGQIDDAHIVATCALVGKRVVDVVRFNSDRNALVTCRP